ncbi:MULTISPECIES: hypothetical protein [unclassified Moraxella]|uniref:tetratricopeptide repeat protein n=1 Tax=unclassified Moraxella TaxID=2685852 RepID=UPI002B4176B0|nr:MULTISPECIES: hypothetical protein [unclassified Moraxella]
MKLQFWQHLYPTKKDSQPPSLGALFAKTKRSKSVVTAIFCCAILLPNITPVYAGVFDPLLKILLPLYKKNNQNDKDDDLVEEEPVQLIDDGKDDDYVPAHHSLTDLLADDISTKEDVPTLDTPDLYALLMAEFAVDRGNIEQALAIYKAESFKANATAVFERALSLSIEYEQPQESLVFANTWQAKNPDHIPAWFYITHLALKAYDYNQAARMLTMILKYDPKADLTQIFGSIFPNEPTDQQALLHALREIDSKNTSVAALRSGLLMRLGEYELSLFHINNALKAEPNNLAFINLKIDILNIAKRKDELWQFLHAKRKALPQETSLYLYEIRHFISQGNLQDAWRLLLTANKNTQNPDVTLLAGLVGLDIGKHKQAIELLTPLTKNPDFASQAHYYLGIGYERLGDALHARQHYEKVKNDDNVLEARTKVVGFYLLDNNVEAAMSTLVRLRDEYEIYATDSYILQAEIRLRQGDTESAKDILTTANRQYPNDDRLLFASYQLLENELGDDEKQDIIAKLVKLDPHNLAYQLSLAKLNLHANPNDENALAIAKAISQTRADDPLYDKDLQLNALILLSENALLNNDYQAIISHLQAPYEVSLDLNAGILLLRAYQGLGNEDMVQKILAELQAKYDFNNPNDNNPNNRPNTNITQLY